MMLTTMSRFGAAALLVLLAAGSASAATLDTVTVSSVTPLAAESGKVPGRIRFTRTGSIGDLIVIYETVGSTATAAATEGSYLGGAWPVGDKDYQTFPNLTVGFTNRHTITIPAGSASADLVVQPFQDTAVEGNEVVGVNIVDDVTYITGPRFTAQVVVADDDTLTVLSMPKFSPTEYLAGVSGAPPFEALFRLTFSNNDLSRFISTQMSGLAGSSDYTMAAMYRHYGSSVTGATVNNAGNGYTLAPSVTLPGGTSVRSLAITTAGTNYTSPPLITFATPAGGRAARAQAVITGGVVTGVTLYDGGEGYASAPVPTVVRVDGTVGTDAVIASTLSFATAQATMQVGWIDPSTTPLSSSVAPAVLISGGGGTGATATATVSAVAPYVITSINIQSGGTGYTSQPLVYYLESDGTARNIGTAYLSLERVWITNGGMGYQSVPTMTITPPTGAPSGTGYPGNSTATATAQVTAGTVTAPAPGDTVLTRRTDAKFSQALARTPINGAAATYGDGKKNNTTVAVVQVDGIGFAKGDVISISGQADSYVVTLVDNNVLHISPALVADVADNAGITNVVSVLSGTNTQFSTNLLAYYSKNDAAVATVLESAYWGIEYAVTPIDDSTAEGAEDVTLRVVSSTDYALTDPTIATMYISDDDATADIALGANASEPDQAGFARITMSTALPVDVSVPYAVTSSTSSGITPTDYATLGVDCVDMTDDGINGIVTIPAGATTVEIQVQPLADAINEGSERLTITLLNSPDYLLAGGPGSQQNPSATINIVDRQGTVGCAVYPEGGVPAFGGTATDLDGVAGESMTAVDKASVRILFASRSSGANQPFAISYSTTAGSTATAGSDYTTLTGAVTIPANQPKATLSVAAIGGQSSASVVLESGTRAMIAGEFILIGGTPYQLAAPVTLSNAGAQTVTLTTTLVANSPAGDPVGLEALSSGFTGTPVEVQIVPRDDQIVEGDEILVLTLSSGQGYQIAENASSAVVTIHDDEPVLQVAVTVGTNPVESFTGGAVSQSSFQVTYSGTPLTRAVPFTITVGAGTATEGVDYATLSRAYTIPANTNGISIPVTVIDDLIKEGTETIIVSIVAPASTPAYAVSAVAGTATMTIGDDEPVVAIQAVAVSGTEGGTPPSFRLVNQTAAQTGGVQLARNLDVAVAITGGTISTTTTATTEADINSFGATVTIPANSSASAAVSIDVRDDTLIEGDETIVISIVANSGYAIDAAAASTTLTIRDNTEPTLTITGGSTILEPASGTTSVAAFTVNAVNASTGGSAYIVPVDVRVNLSFSGTSSENVDYTVPASTTITAGASSATVTVVVNADSDYEGNETIIATLVAGSPARYNVSPTAGSANVTIDDYQDNAASVQVAASAVANGAEPLTNGTLRVTCTETVAGALAGVGGSITVPITVSGTATGGTDYVALPASVVFTSAPQSIDIPVVVIGDALSEGNETVILTVGADTVTAPALPRRWQVPSGTASATITITDFTTGSGKPPIDPAASNSSAKCGLGGGIGMIGLGLLVVLRLRRRG
jgi:hypothetical protein